MDGNVRTAGTTGGQVGCQVGAGWRNGCALPHSLNIPDCCGISMAACGVFHPSVGGSSTWLNRVMEGSRQLSLGLTISRPSRTSHLVMITNSPMARHSSLTLSTKGMGLWAHWRIAFLCPMLQASAIGLGQKYWHLPHILIF